MYWSAKGLSNNSCTCYVVPAVSYGECSVKDFNVLSYFYPAQTTMYGIEIFFPSSYTLKRVINTRKFNNTDFSYSFHTPDIQCKPK